jgi:spermidine/putrescine transport system permease protein
MIAKIKSLFSSEWSFFLSLPALVWHILLFYIPLLCILLFSFVYIDEQTGRHIVSWHNYYLLHAGVYVIIIIKSIMLATGVAVLSLFIGYPLAYYIALKQYAFKNIFLSFLIIPFWTNVLVHIYAWFFVLERNGILNTVLLKIGIIREPIMILNTMYAVVLVMVYCYLPFMVLPLFSILEKFDTRLIEASLDLGASQKQTFLNVILPLTYPGIATGFFLVLVPAFGEFMIPLLLGGDKHMFVGTLIAHYFLIAATPEKGAAFTIMSSMILIGIVGIMYIGSRRLNKWMARV